MKCHNSCFVVGYLGNDPIERGKTEKFGPVVKFTVAENVTRYDKESESYETVHTNWFQVTAFGSVAERAKVGLKKGERVAVHGRMKVSKFTDRSGEERNGFEILADEIALWKSLPSHLSQTSEVNESCNERGQLDESSTRRPTPAPASRQPLPSHGSAASRPRANVGPYPRGSQKLGA